MIRKDTAMKTGVIKSSSTNNAIVSSMSLSLFAKLFNLAQSVVVSYAFGTSTGTDILFYTLSLIILLTTFQGSLNRQVVVPNLIEIRNGSPAEETRGFISTIYLFYAAMGIAATAALLISPEGILLAVSRFEAAEIRANLGIVRLIVPALVLIIINTYLLDIFTGYRFFNLPMLLDMLKNGLIIAAVILLRRSFSVESLALGVLMGNLLQFVVLNILLVRLLQWRPTLRIFKLSGTVRRNMAYVLAGRAATFANDFVIIYLMSGFAEGVYTAMDYALRIDAVVNSVIIGQITTVVGMNIMELHSRKKINELRETFMRYFKFSLFAVLPISFILSLNAYPVISLLFERGSFTHQAAETTAMFLKLFILTMPFELVNGFIVILIIARQIQRIAFLWQISQNILNVFVIWLFIKYLGYYGYPAGLLVATAIYVTVLCHFLVKSRFEFIKAGEMLKLFGINLCMNVPLVAAIYLIIPGQPGSGVSDRILLILWSSLLYLVVYLIINWFTGFNRQEILRAVSYVGGLVKPVPAVRQSKGEEV